GDMHHPVRPVSRARPLIKNMGKKISLLLMKEKQKGKISLIDGGFALRNRMMSMGLYEGREITKLSHFALRGPVAIKVGRSVIALGHGMASKIIMETE
ncbi:MAG: ferrous iron transport protein A, partial [Candidatus Omnitrophica bacterium]|nr:ferrous iron transport protein A [Candidatus Omnitrophota bacterium]